MELKTAQMALGRLQRLACLCISGAMRTTPTAAMEVILGLPPLNIFIEGEAMSACQRLIRTGLWKSRGAVIGHRRIKGQLEAEMPTFHHRSDYTIPSFNFERNFEVLFPSREDWTSHQEELLPQDCMSCYTAGSRMNDRAGAGVHYSNCQGEEDQSILLGMYATVFQAEIYGILSCADRLRNYQSKDISIYSDSQAAIKALASPRITSCLVRECRMVVQRLAVHNNVRIIWIPGHSGIDGNEQSDQLAKEGSNMPYVGPEPVVGISSQAGKGAIKSWIRQQHGISWQSTNGCRQSKELIGGPNPKVSNSLLNLSQQQLRMIVGLLTGHCGLNRHLAIMGVIPDPICALCGEEEETALHFLGQCMALSAIRHRIFGMDPLSPRDIRRITVTELLGFIQASGRFDTE